MVSEITESIDQELQVSPLQLRDMIKAGNIPHWVIFCEGGDYRSGLVATYAREAKHERAVYVRWGIAGICNLNPYDSKDVPQNEFSEEEQKEIIQSLAKVPNVLFVLNKQEFRDYKHMIAAIQVSVEHNHGKCFLASNLSAAYKIVGVI